MKISDNSASDPKVALFERLFSLCWPKTLGSTIAISLFFVAYFWVLNHPGGDVRMMPVLPPDHWVPVVSGSAWVYFSLWVYICIPSSLMIRLSELGCYLKGATLISLCGILIFYFLPTAVPVWEVDWSQYPSLHFLKESDASGNACPSLHVAFALYSGLWLDRMLKVLVAGHGWRLANGLWCMLIVFSTMTTKQHVLIDVLCGALLGTLVFWLNKRFQHKLI